MTKSTLPAASDRQAGTAPESHSYQEYETEAGFQEAVVGLA